MKMKKSKRRNDNYLAIKTKIYEKANSSLKNTSQKITLTINN
jgi:hypothetical protein